MGNFLRVLSSFKHVVEGFVTFVNQERNIVVLIYTYLKQNQKLVNTHRIPTTINFLSSIGYS